MHKKYHPKNTQQKIYSTHLAFIHSFTMKTLQRVPTCASLCKKVTGWKIVWILLGKNHEKVRVRKVQEPFFFKGSHQVVKKCKSVLASGDQIPSYQPPVKKETACNRSRYLYQPLATPTNRVGPSSKRKSKVISKAESILWMSHERIMNEVIDIFTHLISYEPIPKGYGFID